MQRFNNMGWGSRAFSLVWLPVLTFWVFLIVLHVGQLNYPWGFRGLPLVSITYLASSSYLALELQQRLTTLSRRHESVTQATRLYALIGCLMVSSLIALAGTLTAQSGSLWICFATAVPVVVSKVMEALTDIADQQAERQPYRSEERDNSMAQRAEWHQMLEAATEALPEDRSISEQVARIRRLLPYSSFFRLPLARTDRQCSQHR
jgi:signal transduction histidine kinase